MKNHEIIELFELADQAKNVGNKGIANVVFALLFEASLDSRRISYLYETQEHDTESLHKAADELDDNSAYFDLLVLSYAHRTLSIPFPIIALQVAREFALLASQIDRVQHKRKITPGLNTPCYQRYMEDKLTAIYPDWRTIVRKWLRLPSQETYLAFKGTTDEPEHWQYVMPAEDASTEMDKVWLDGDVLNLGRDGSYKVSIGNKKASRLSNPFLIKVK